MARVTLGPVVADLRGKVGGSIFQRSKHGTTLRALHIPTQHNTQKQALMRGHMFQLQAAWAALTQAQRTAWDAWAAYMSLKPADTTPGSLTGQNAFIRTNRYCLLRGANIFQTPVFTPFSIPLYSLEVQNASGVLLIIMTELHGNNNYAPLVSLSWQLPPGRRSRPKKVRLMIPTAQTIDEDWIITQPYIDAFGGIVGAETIIWADHMIQQIDNGALSAFLSSPIEVTEL